MSSDSSAGRPDDADPQPPGSDAYPLLTAQQRQRIDAISQPEPVALGQKLFQSGDSDVDLFFADDAVVEIVREATQGAARANRCPVRARSVRGRTQSPHLPECVSDRTGCGRRYRAADRPCSVAAA